MTLDDLAATMKTNFEAPWPFGKRFNRISPNMPEWWSLALSLGPRLTHGRLCRLKAASPPGRVPRPVCGSQGKRVNILAPGYVDTDILAGDSPEKRQQREQEVPLQRVGSPEDMAATVSFLVGPDSAYITGAILHVNGGLYLP